MVDSCLTAITFATLGLTSLAAGPAAHADEADLADWFGTLAGSTDTAGSALSNAEFTPFEGVYNSIHTDLQDWITSAEGRTVDGFLNKVSGEFLIGDGANGTAAHINGGAGGLWFGDGGNGFNATGAGAAGGAGGAAGLFGDGGNGGSGGPGGDGGSGGAGGSLAGVGGDGGAGREGGAAGVGDGVIFGAAGTPGAGGTSDTPTPPHGGGNPAPGVNATVPLQMNDTTEPVVLISVNGGPMVPVLVDTGSTGLVIEAKDVGSAGLGDATGSGSANYAQQVDYSYTTYRTTVSFGDGIVTAPTAVDVVSGASETAFANGFGGAGVVGILGIGPDDGYPGTSTIIPALPGDLGQGVLIDEPKGELEFGPNPLPVDAVVRGAPETSLGVRIDGGPLQTVGAVIDSGGANGAIPSALLGSGGLPAGTTVSVYTYDGKDLLYSYTTGAAANTAVTPSDLFNTGDLAFLYGPVYISSSPAGIGETIFDKR